MEKNLIFLVVGLGSMGKRRIRSLKYLNYNTDRIFGYDIRRDRCDETRLLYNVNILDNIDEETLKELKINSLIISVPPDVHHKYMKLANNLHIDCFIEASVIDDGLDEIIANVKENNSIFFPSCTLMFHPAIKIIKNIIETGELGKISHITHHSGQYLPDWHTYEKVSDYYVSNEKTGGCREIVPFELSWLTKIFGFPDFVAGTHKKTIDIEGAEDIDDVYGIILDYYDKVINLTVDVVSRKAIRSLVINGDKKQLKWNWDNNYVDILNPDTQEIDKRSYESLSAEKGYNANITESMYIDELNHYITLTKNSECQPINTLEFDQSILNILKYIEYSYDNKKFMKYTKLALIINVTEQDILCFEKTLNKTYIEWLILRIKKRLPISENCKIMLITNTVTLPKLKQLIQNKYDIYVYTGHNIPTGQDYLSCVEKYGFTHIIPINCNNVLTSIETCEKIYETFKDSNRHVVVGKNLPKGMDVYGFSSTVLLYNKHLSTLDKVLEKYNKKDILYLDRKLYHNFVTLQLNNSNDHKLLSFLINHIGDRIESISDNELVNFVKDSGKFSINSLITYNANQDMGEQYYNKDVDLEKLLTGKRVAYVCPASYLKNNKEMGKIIDSYDVVCRVGEAGPIDSELHCSYGSRTDIILTGGTGIWFSFLEKDKNISYFKKHVKFVINPRADNEWGCMRSGKIDDYFRQITNNSVPFHQVRNDYAYYIASKVAPKSSQTGTLGLIILLNYNIKELFITGMDFYNFGNYDEKTVYYNGYPDPPTMPSGKKKTLGHPQEQQLLFFMQLLKRYKLITIDSHLEGKLKQLYNFTR